MERKIWSACVKLIVAISMFLLSACTPVVNYPGNPSVEPRIEKENFVACDGAILPIRSWLPVDAPVKAVIVALHGFNDYGNAFTPSGAYLSRHNIACYAYDQRGFGKTAGRGLWAGIDAYSKDLSSFVKVVQKRHPAIPLYVMGESMGGAVTIVTMAGNDPPKVDGVILVAPAVWARDTMPWYQRWLLALASHTIPWVELTGKGLKVRASDNVEMLRTLRRDPLVIKATRIDAMYGLTNLMDRALLQSEKLQIPTLIQYGQNDQVIPKEPTMLMLSKTPKSVKKTFYKNGYHMLLRDLQAEKPLADIVSWITDRNKPLPYGADNWK